MFFPSGYPYTFLSFRVLTPQKIKTSFEFSMRFTKKRYIICQGAPIDQSKHNLKAHLAQIDLDALVTCNHNLTTPTAPILHVVIPLSPAQNNLALLIATMLLLKYTRQGFARRGLTSREQNLLMLMSAKAL